MARTQAKSNTPATKKTETPAATQNTASPSQRNASSHPTREQIARRAYELFLARGASHGQHEQDWLQAERELKLGR